MRVKSISSLKKEADKYCSLYVRQSNADWQGMVECYTCYKKFLVLGIQCGHYISRVYTITRWLLINLKPQCYSCNVMKHGAMDEFAIRLEAETPGILKRLNDLKHTKVSTLKTQDLQMVINDFKEKLKNL